MADISKVLDTSIPQGSASPTDLDTFIQDTKEGFRERLAIDHEFDLVGATTAVEVAEISAGKHKQVTISNVRADPSLTDPNAMIYTKGDPQELYFANDTNVIQITNGTVLASPTVDDSTIEINGSSQLAIKTPAIPSTGANMYPAASKPALLLYGTYTGDSDAQTLDLGATLRWIKICDTIQSFNVEAMYDAVNGLKVRNITTGGILNTITTSDGQTLTIAGGSNGCNVNRRTYQWVALCER